jgi:rhodanese-related sulfurtransferase
MSSINLSDLQYITREDLAHQLGNSQSGTVPSNMAIIDVRDSDHVGGHIRGSTWVPSSELDYKTPELVRNLKDKDTVVFHCVLSQQRGPNAALRYLREKERLDPTSWVESESGEVKEEGEGVKKGEAVGEAKGEGKKQKVVVLSGGFEKWQEKFGSDNKLTEGWQKDIWEYGS